MGLLSMMIPRYHVSAWPYQAIKFLDTFIFNNQLRLNGVSFSYVMEFIIPCIFILLIGAKLTDFGLGLGNRRLGLKMCLIFYILYIPCFYFLFTDEASNRYYSGVTSLKSWQIFFEKEVFSTFMYMLTTEFQFRGFLLLGLRKYIGDFAATAVAVLPYVLLHKGKPEMEALGSFPVGLALSYLALKTNSIWYGLLLHWSIALFYNGLILYLNFK
jgi:membrane protease YdiL (CAAX protease family)